MEKKLKGSETNSKSLKNSQNSQPPKENTNSNTDANILPQLEGLNDKFPIENFIKLKSTQKGKEINLQTYKYPAQGELRGIVYLLHGLYEHSNSNANVARILSEQGFEVLSFDLRGHGKSEGIRGFLENRQIITEDINNFIKLTETEYADKTPNKYALGYSFGGLFANLIAMERKDYFSGLVLLAPAFHTDDNKYSFSIKIAKILNSIYPTLPLVDIKAKIDDQAIVKYINSDPFIYKGKLRVGTGMTIMDSVKYSNENYQKVSTPVYLLHGRNDTIVNYSGASNYFEKIPVKDKTFLLLDDMHHHFIRTPEINSYVKDIAFWMRVHSK